FGLRMKRLPRRQIELRVAEAIAMVSLAGLERRKPAQLSGGQKQRVALARAIVNRPQVLLLDEPLAALDAKLRRAMQIELKHLQSRLGITFVFVTHDQEEAVTMSDRIAVMNSGRIEQIGLVTEVYHRPRTSFVASFLGHANIYPARVVARSDESARIRIADCLELRAGANVEDSVLASIRPERVQLFTHKPEGENVFDARVQETLFKGHLDQILLRIAEGLELTAMVANRGNMDSDYRTGQDVFCRIDRDDIVILRDD